MWGVWCGVCGVGCRVFHQAAEPVLPVLQTVRVQEHLRSLTVNTPSIDLCVCSAKWRQLRARRGARGEIFRARQGWSTGFTELNRYLSLLRQKRHRLLGAFGPDPPAVRPKHFGESRACRVRKTKIAQMRRSCKERAGAYHPCRGSCNPFSCIESDRIFWARRPLSPFPFPFPPCPSVATR